MQQVPVLPCGYNRLIVVMLVSALTACADRDPTGGASSDSGANDQISNRAGTAVRDQASASDTPVVAKQSAVAPDGSPRSDSSADSATSGPTHTNRLANESSPYLRLHAHNPVDWYPWGDEALAKAQREQKLIFLSVGYSSCYWCHVMERESFMDDEIAAYLNEHYVCIKVDREERPDIDSIYMLAVQMLTRRGGWPMSVFMTPDTKPFFGGTYFPARDGDRPGATGFLTVIRRVQQLWASDADQIKNSSTEIAKLLQGELRGAEASMPVSAELLEGVTQALRNEFDSSYGGFGFNDADPQLPKFPEPSNLLLLVDRVRRVQDDQAREMLLTTLDQMSRGGIYDHLGGGYHRYSTDRFWRIPHFEKMLYDNGQLLTVLAETYELTQSDELRHVAAQTAAFLAREMTSPQGGFYSAIDAESEQVEGKFYRWRQTDVKQVLGSDYEPFAAVYGLDGPANFEQEFHVLLLAQPLAETATERGVSVDALRAELQTARQTLLGERNRRPRPLTDEKILTSWNGLCIRGLADAGRLMDRPQMVDMAEAAAEFVLAHLREPGSGRLLRTFTQGEAKLNAYLDDYAFLVNGLIGLHCATGQERWLQTAAELTTQQIDNYWDEQSGGFFFTSSDHEALIARAKQYADGAQPSGNSVSAQNLIYLSEALDRPDYLEYARRTVESATPLMQRVPRLAPRMAIAAMSFLPDTRAD